MPSRHTVALVLTPDLRRRLREEAERTMLSVSAVARLAILHYFLSPNRTIGPGNVTNGKEGDSNGHATAASAAPTKNNASFNESLTPTTPEVQ